MMSPSAAKADDGSDGAFLAGLCCWPADFALDLPLDLGSGGPGRVLTVEGKQTPVGRCFRRVGRCFRRVGLGDQDRPIRADKTGVITSRGSVRPVMARLGTAIMLVMSLIGLVVLGINSPGGFDADRAFQLAATLIVPVAVMLLFWRAARARLLDRETELGTVLGLESVTSRATGRFLAAVSHELTAHPEVCSLRAEALVVAVDYQEAGANLKVAVPDLVIETDPHLLRQFLHVLVGNAVRHGGGRVAIWAVAEAEWVRLTVSDDGPGLPEEIDGGVFDRYVDLADQARTGTRSGSGLGLARALGDLIGGEVDHKTDSNWTHFSLRLPLGANGAATNPERVPLQVGAR